METKSILIKDTDGQLSTDLFKNHLERPALSVWFDYEAPHQTLKFSTNNIRFDSIPDMNKPHTHVTFLAYNGTMGMQNRVFSHVIKKEIGNFVSTDVPVLSFQPHEFISNIDIETEAESVLEINLFDGSVNVLDYSTDPLRNNNRNYDVKFLHTYPASIHGVPNVVNNSVYMDGWYTYTQVIFRDIGLGDLVFKDRTYAYNGFIFKASIDGIFAINPETGSPSIQFDGDGDGVVENVELIQPFSNVLDAQDLPPIPDIPGPTYQDQVEQSDYESILFYISEQSNLSPQSGGVYLHSQVLITQQLKDAIIKEVTDMALVCNNACTYMDWQKLQLKQIAAYVFFDNELFEKAQIVIESSRSMCLGGNDNFKVC